MTGPWEYSEAELRLIREICPGLADVGINRTIYPDRLYGTLAKIAFLDRRTGPEAEALRRVLVHLNSGVSRMTPEFDKLCQF